MLIRLFISLGGVFTLLLELPLFAVLIEKFNHMGRLKKNGRFFENPLVGRHVENGS
jgi:hypothetical protein